MTPACCPRLVINGIFAVAAVAVVGLVVAGSPEETKVSSYAPAEDLISQLERDVSILEEVVADERQFGSESGRDTVANTAHAIKVVALALAVHDEEHALKKSAPALLEAAAALAAAEEQAAAKTALGKLQAAAEGKAGASGEKLRWKKVAPQGPIMTQVEVAQSSINRGLRRVARRPEAVQRAAALIAVVAQQVRFDPPEGVAGAKLQQWLELCDQMRQAAADINKAARAKDADAAKAAAERLELNCQKCHESFRDN